MSRPTNALCHIDDLADPGSDGFELDGTAIMVVRRDGEVFGYVNSCPHVRSPLDFQPGHFLDPDRQFIQCASHGALFRIDDGVCLAGPCSGKSLTPVGLTLSDGWILPRRA